MVELMVDIPITEQAVHGRQRHCLRVLLPDTLTLFQCYIERFPSLLTWLVMVVW